MKCGQTIGRGTGRGDGLRRRGSALLLLGALMLSGWPAALAQQSQAAGDDALKILFSTSRDVSDTWGMLHFGAAPMQKVRSCESPGFSLAHCRPMGDGAWEVYGQVFQRGKEKDQTAGEHVWKLVRATTRDGARFENVETVYTSAPGPWTDHLGLAWNPLAKQFLALKLHIDNNGFAYRAFFSPDGRAWKEHPDRALFYDGDSMGLFWNETARRFICSSKTLQPHRKRLQDHGGTHPQNQDDTLRDRRVLAMRSSADGRTWEPKDSLMDVWNRLGTYKALPARQMLTPDEQDPPDMEFYRGIGFWYHDRAFLVVLNYAASPLLPRKHGPQLDTEWWVSQDAEGMRWERPYRGINALGDSFPGVPCITHNPMVIDGMLLFHFGNHLAGMKRDRITYVGARANAEFSTAAFRMPSSGELRLNAAAPAPDRPFAAQQAYVMAAVLNEDGKVVPGFEAAKCVLQKADGIDLPLRWDGKSARELAGQRVKLRFHMRSANVYAVTSSPGQP